MEWQLRIAEGEHLPEEMGAIEPRGHAIEVRLYAEDPYKRFAPSPGKIELLRLPEGPGIRNDCGVYEGGEVTIHYDPMLAKLIAWGADRGQALNRLRRALNELRVEGIRTTAPLYLRLLADPDFLAGNLDIGMLDRKLAAGELDLPAEDHPELPVLAAAIAHHERAGRVDAPQAQGSAQSAGPERGRRSTWHQAGRRESLHGGGRWI